MPDHKENTNKAFEKANVDNYQGAQKIALFLTTSLCMYGLMRKGNYQAAFRLYRHGGGGFNIYKIMGGGRRERRFAMDYHPVRNKASQKDEWLLHFHYGHNYSQRRKHRPYQGGWRPKAREKPEETSHRNKI